MKRVWLIVFLTSAFAASPPKKSASPPKKPPEDYTSWNNKWFVTCRGENFIVNIKVDNPKSPSIVGQTPGSHKLDAFFLKLKGEGDCLIGSDAPKTRSQFLFGEIFKGKIKGLILLCTKNQILVDANHLPAIFGEQFEATYDPQKPSISGRFKGEQYKESGDGTKQPYQRDEPNDPKAAFEMHLYRPGYDVSPNGVWPGATPTPESPGSQAIRKLPDVVHDGTYEWGRIFLKKFFDFDY
jgi:hypothetical protein